MNKIEKLIELVDVDSQYFGADNVDDYLNDSNVEVDNLIKDIERVEIEVHQKKQKVDCEDKFNSFNEFSKSITERFNSGGIVSNPAYITAHSVNLFGGNYRSGVKSLDGVIHLDPIYTFAARYKHGICKNQRKKG